MRLYQDNTAALSMVSWNTSLLSSLYIKFVGTKHISGERSKKLLKINCWATKLFLFSYQIYDNFTCPRKCKNHDPMMLSTNFKRTTSKISKRSNKTVSHKTHWALLQSKNCKILKSVQRLARALFPNMWSDMQSSSIHSKCNKRGYQTMWMLH